MDRLECTPMWDRSLITRWVIKQRRRGDYAALKKAAEARKAESNSSNG